MKKYVYLLFSCMALSLGVLAQFPTATLSTNSYSAGGNASQAGVAFNFSNNNSFPVVVSEINSFCNPNTGSVSYTLYHRTSAINGSATVANIPTTPATWINDGTVVKVNPTGGLNTLFTGLSITIPANTTYGFCVYGQTGFANAPVVYRTSITGIVPVTFTSNNCAITIANLTAYGGASPSLTFTPRGFLGEVKFAAVPNAAPTMCASNMLPINGAGNQPITAAVSWDAAFTASGYRVTMGDNPPGFDNIANNFDVGNTMSYDPPGILNASTVYGWTVVPYNSFGTSTGAPCPVNQFLTSGCGSYPTGVSHTVVNETTANITWSDANASTPPGTTWDVEYGPFGFTVGTGTVANSATTSLSLNTLTPGTRYQYYVYANCGVSGNSTPVGPFTLFPMDICEGAPTLTMGATCVNSTFNSIGSSQISGQSHCVNAAGGTQNRDVWFKFVATTGTVRIQVAPKATSATFYPTIELYSGSCGGLTSICCAFNGAGPGLTAAMNRHVTVGQTYYVKIGHAFATTVVNEEFDICVIEQSAAPCGALPGGTIDFVEAETCTQGAGGASTGLNQTCATATAITLPPVGTYAMTGTIAASCNLRDLDYYTFTLTQPAYVRFDQVALHNGQFIVYSGTCAALTQLVLNTGVACTPFTTTLNLPAGQYWMLVTTNNDFLNIPCGMNNEYQINVTTLCANPIGIAVSNYNPTAGSVDASWGAVVGATSYNWQVVPYGNTPGTGVVASGTGVIPPSATISGLTNATGYTLYVQGDCNTVAWGRHDFAVYTCGDPFADFGGMTAYADNENSTFLVAPNVPGGYVEATFTAFGVEATWDALYVHNGPSDAAPLVASANPVTGAGFPAGGYYGTTNPGPFVSSHASGALTFRFRSDANTVDVGWNANITCTTCPRATMGVSSNVIHNAATISWAKGAVSTGYRIEYGPTGFTLGTGSSVTGTYGAASRTLTGLMATTAYQWYVVDDCGAGGLSSAAGPFTFTTQTGPPPVNDQICSAANMPGFSGTFMGFGTYNLLATTKSCNTTTSNNQYATSDAVAASCGDANGKGMWYKFTAPACSVGGLVPFTITASTDNSATTLDTKLAVFSSSDNTCNGTLTEIACNDDKGDAPNTPANSAGCETNASIRPSTINLTGNLVPGNTYFVYVDGWNAGVGTFELGLFANIPVPVAAPNTANPGTKIDVTCADLGVPMRYAIRMQGATGAAFTGGGTANSGTSTYNNAVPGVTYDLQRLVSCTPGKFLMSEVVNYTTPTIPGCAVITDLQCESSTTTSMTVSCTDQPSSRQLTCYWRAVGSTHVSIFTFPRTVASGRAYFTITNLIPGTQYDVWLYNTCETGYHLKSNTVACQTAGVSMLANTPTDETLSFEYDGVEYEGVSLSELGEWGIKLPDGMTEGSFDVADGRMTFSPFINSGLATDQLDFVMAPNPTSGNTQLYVNVTKPSNDVVLTITDALGRIVDTRMVGEVSNGTVLGLETQAFAAGVYHVTLRTGEQLVSRKLVVR